MSVTVTLLDLTAVHGTSSMFPDTFRVMLAALAVAPDDKNKWGVLGDWCEENSEPELAAVCRWLFRRWPDVVVKKNDRDYPTGFYLSGEPNKPSVPLASDLPQFIHALAVRLQADRLAAKKLLEDLS